MFNLAVTMDGILVLSLVLNEVCLYSEYEK